MTNKHNDKTVADKLSVAMEKIAKCLDGIERGDLTQAERKIVSVLMENGFVRWQEHTELEIVVESVRTKTEETMVELHDWRYEVEMGGGVDKWRLSGTMFGHPSIRDSERGFVSTPKQFDVETRELTTASGRKYKLFSCSGNEEEQIAHILADIERGGTKRW